MYELAVKYEEDEPAIKRTLNNVGHSNCHISVISSFEVAADHRTVRVVALDVHQEI